MKSINNAIDYYDRYMKFKGTAGYARQLARVLYDVETDIHGLKGSIGSFFKAYNKLHGNFDQLFDIMTFISTILTKTKMAIAIGCVEDCRSSSRCKKACNSRPR